MKDYVAWIGDRYKAIDWAALFAENAFGPAVLEEIIGPMGPVVKQQDVVGLFAGKTKEQQFKMIVASFINDRLIRKSNDAVIKSSFVPPKHQIVLHSDPYITVILGNWVFIYDRKTGKLVKKEKLPDDMIAPLASFEKATELVAFTEGLNGFEDVNLAISKNLLSSISVLKISAEKIITPRKD